MSKPRPINLVPHAAMLEGSEEFLRMWRSTTGGPVSCFIDPARLGADPALFGMAVADAVRHAARAWARAVDVTVEHAEQRIWEGLDAERATPTDEPQEPLQLSDDAIITYTKPETLN